MDDDRVSVPRETLQRLLDAVASSLDFGSGYMETDDVTAMRAVAVLLGVDPVEVTPSEFAKRMPHAYRAAYARAVRCKWCALGPFDPVHGAVEAVS